MKISTISLMLLMINIVASSLFCQVWNTNVDNQGAKDIAEKFEVLYEDEMEEIGANPTIFKKETMGSLNYRFFAPSPISQTKKYPLIIFLHGAMERGSDNEKQMGQGALMWALKINQDKYPCFIIAPQCPSGKQWVNTPWENGSYKLSSVKLSSELQTVLQIINDKINSNPIDLDRIYITGLSMGGFGTWDMIMRNPTMFAAAIPICGGSSPDDASIVKHIPIKTFHGKSDGVVPYDGTYQITDAIYNAGGKFIDMTTYQNGSHIIWGNAYSSAGIVDWLFSQKRGAPVSTQPTKEYLKIARINSVYPTVTKGFSLSGRTIVSKDFNFRSTQIKIDSRNAELTISNILSK